VAFEWDEAKAQTNLEKHGVSFDEATSVFEDDDAGIKDDLDHSVGEHREIIVGRSAQGRLLLISFTERGENIRIISARAATRRERRFYEEENR
jgi:uncharacterized DUF497 family protein